MSIIQFPIDPMRAGTERKAVATEYRLKAAALGRQIAGENDPTQAQAYLMNALSMLQLAENEEWLAKGE
ncbi:MAG: hypothetical protein JWR89_744 [Tardiphaga sp.]|jgi:hypothetical protein|uniref:hypothetical protein n=1 Tax=Tardiphaga sp. TaxID=1926292 RepID=UPI0026109294|nr:hypothetical protein [Tardiphaga sp.]MDB5500842.1 hypothetical protein [Tardiphaga sp.]